MRIASTITTAALAALLIAGCGDDDTMESGELSVTVYGEEFIEEGIPADEFIDGWTVTFDSFVVDIGAIQVARADEAPTIEATSFATFDLTQPTAGAGQRILSEPVPGGAYDQVSYQVRSVVVSGSAAKGDSTVSFDWTFDAPTTYSRCESTAIVDGGDATTQLTIHADHLFYDDLVSSEPNLAFDLIADADADDDGVVTRAELAVVDIQTLERYQVGNKTSVTDLWAFIDAQVATLGHIDGEGHCGQAERLP